MLSLSNKKVIILSVLLAMSLTITSKSKSGEETDSIETRFIYIQSFTSEKDTAELIFKNGAGLLSYDLQELCRDLSQKQIVKIQKINFKLVHAKQQIADAMSSTASGKVVHISDSNKDFFVGLENEGTHFMIFSEYTKKFIGTQSEINSTICAVRREGSYAYFDSICFDPVRHLFQYELKENDVHKGEAYVLQPLAKKIATALDISCKEPEVPVKYIYPMELECHPDSLFTRLSGLPAKLVKKLETGKKGRIRMAEDDSMTNMHLKVTVYDMMKETEITANIWLSNKEIIASGFGNYPSNSSSGFSKAINSIVKKLLKELESR